MSTSVQRVRAECAQCPPGKRVEVPVTSEDGVVVHAECVGGHEQPSWGLPPTRKTMRRRAR